MSKIAWKMKSSSSLAKPFTLIEVLVVVAIIGILASLLMPVLSKARKKARNVICINNQKQINLALVMFAEDNDDELPIPPGGQHSWDDELSGYDGRPTLTDDEKNGHAFAKSVYGENYGAIYKCPFEEPHSAGVQNMTYAITQAGSNRMQKGLLNSSESLQLNEVSQSSATIMLFEYPYSRCRLGWNNYNIKRATDQRSLINGGTQMLHGPYKSNYLMVDGHVEGLEIDATVVPYGANTIDVAGSLWDATK